MPYKFIGRTTELCGKSLWEIVGNLKDFGVGRVFVRNRFERYPEKSWFKILQVETHEAPKDVPLYAFDVSFFFFIEHTVLINFLYFCVLQKPRLVSIKCEKYWRGQKLSEPIFISGGSYKPDYRLIPKADETEYCQVIESTEKKTPLAQTVDFPPLLRVSTSGCYFYN
jgi:small subunit ribosomal protein S34